MLMSMNRNRARFAVLACLATTAVAAGCDRVKHELLEPQNPGLVDPSAVGSPTAALALRVGALGRYKQVQSGESIWQYGGTLADEFKNADFEAGRINADMRLTDVSVSWNYNGVTQSRGFVRDAIAAMQKFNPDSSALIGELYMELAFFEMTLADNYCNGIPLGHTANEVRTNGSPRTIAQVYDSASSHLDTALALTAGTNAASVYINRAARVWKARVMIAKDTANLAAAAALLATVPTSFVYDMTFSSVSGSNGMWSLVNSTARISVGDSFDILNGVPNTIKNALPFASAKDPRVPVVNGDSASPKVVAEDQVTRPFYVALLFKGQFDPLVLASGIDARLYEAEAKLDANDIPGMMTILNYLRTDTPRPVIGVTTIPAMGALPTPASKEDAISLLFREKAYWTLGRGARRCDLSPA